MGGRKKGIEMFVQSVSDESMSDDLHAIKDAFSISEEPQFPSSRILGVV